MGRLFWIIQLGPKYTHVHSYTREAEEDFTLHRAEGDVKAVEGDWRMMALKIKVMQASAKESL